MKHNDTRDTKAEIDQLSHEIIGSAIEVHRAVGPGFLESIYEDCLAHELALRGIRFKRQVHVPLVYKGVSLECGYRLDMLVEEKVVLELKAVEHILPVHEVQLLTYLRLTGKWLGLLLNFHVTVLQRGIRRVVN
ncbi:MAG TPA: GxxExxY protein [Planctomycetota bacterium]|jgi:GxxExxY protein|nr:GxxExxY protein [Planctomycetota bacterium]